MKNKFNINQVWISKTNPDKSFYIYQMYFPDFRETSELINEDSFILAILINKTLFNKKVEEYQSTHKVKDTNSTYPYCIYKEGKISSFNDYVRKYNCELLGIEDFEEDIHKDVCFHYLKDEEDSLKKIWLKYSK